IRPAARPMAALNQKPERQPYARMIAVRMGGVSAEPAPTPAKITPLTRPRSLTGIQRATNWLEVGYMTASPPPRANRTQIRIERAPGMEGGTAAVARVTTPHQRTPRVRARRGPRRTAIHPASSCDIA